ncbi:sugar diacid recognition domain-containing protein [Psychromonas aquimarina]|uniref:sugar diacid recognition domain-containing protein n=1 Tax=Psychromonas aquimarina TaxID=444919 RepID=UPI000411F31D|nr:sugar diacid recognition domain-containing protein [Psychromonas aquimarina]
MQLTESIAKQIVKRSMKIIKHSVNVINEHGIIIGSGDPSRISRRHEGAVLAINENRIVEIDGATAKQLRGVKPGINLPIIFQHKVIGVVGISGDPAEVRNYGELVKMTAELIIEQSALTTQFQWNKRHREELVLQLIQGSQLNEAQLESIAERLDLDLSQPRIAAIVKVDSFNGEHLSLEHLQKLVELLEYPERDNLVAIASVSMNEVVVLKPITLSDGGWSRKEEEKRIQQLMQRIASEGKFTIRIALGSYFPTLQGLSKSFKTAKATIESSSSKGNVLFYQDNILPVIFHGLKQDTWRYEQLCQPLTRLKKNDSKGTLLKTLTVFFKQNCDIAQTCKALYIHRNTLRYRFDKIQLETGLDINKIDEKTRLYLAVINQ